MGFFGESVFIVTLLRSYSWSEFPSSKKKTSKVCAEVTLAGKTLLVVLIAEPGGNGHKAIRALLDQGLEDLVLGSEQEVP